MDFRVKHANMIEYGLIETCAHSGSNTPPLRLFFGINVENGPKSIKMRRAVVPELVREVVI